MQHNCKCGIEEGMSLDQLKALLPSCTEHHHHPYICPVWDRARRKWEAANQWRKHYNKKLKKAGFSQEQIDAMPRKKGRGKRSNITAKVVEIDLENI